MAHPVIHAAEAEAARDFSLSARVRAGTAVVIEHNSQAAVLLRQTLRSASLSGI